MDDRSHAQTSANRWLLLLHQLPAKPAYFRVKIWRRLQALGAVAVKNAVYALPANEQRQEDFEWLLREISEGGGEAMLCEARLIEGLSDQEVRALFSRARDEDYDAIATEARSLGADLGDEPPPEKRAEVKGQLTRLKNRLAQVVGIDFFGADRRVPLEGLLAELEHRVAEPAGGGAPEATSSEADALQNYRGRTWVTRQGVYVDRIASAWLIRRFIDPEARFKFVPAKGYEPEPGNSASTCSRPNSPTRATSAPSRSCSSAPRWTTRRSMRSGRSCTTLTSRTRSSVATRQPALHA